MAAAILLIMFADRIFHYLYWHHLRPDVRATSITLDITHQLRADLNYEPDDQPDTS